jgi:hypothetical protein
MTRQVFTKVFPDFRTGLAEMRSLCRPIHDSLTASEQGYVRLGLLLDLSFENLTEYFLFLRATKAAKEKSSGKTFEYAAVSKAGFKYRTASNCVFGWKATHSGGYRFVVRVDRFSPRRNPNYQAEMFKNLMEAGWTLMSNSQVRKDRDLLDTVNI